ncbi:MAG: hypothetical protein IPP94_14940 [Ignavibacteria bacterium]|nr:hypothetical protein [Ignavibacteria bacterium]
MRTTLTFRRNLSGRAALLTLMFVLCGGRGIAQTSPFDTFFGEFNGVAIWTSLGVNADRVPSRRNDVPLFEQSPIRFGFELLLGPYPAQEESPEMAGTKHAIDSLRTRLETEKLGATLPADTTLIPRLESSLEAQLRRQSVLQRFADENAPAVQVDLGVGFEYTDSFRPDARDYTIKMPLTGVYVSAYVSHDLVAWENGSAGIYVGGNVGHFELHNAVAYGNTGDDAEYEVTASTYALEPILGCYLYYESGRISPFIEFSYKYLAFDALHYREISGGPPATGAPRRLDLSGVYLTIGLQMAKK